MSPTRSILVLVPLALAGVYLAAAVDAPTPPHAPRKTPWATSRVAGSPETPPAFRSVNAFPKVKFNHPVVMKPVPGSTRLVVGEQDGKVFSFANASDAVAELILDLRKEIATLDRHPGAKELENLFGFAFHPKFPQVRECFISYSLRGKKNEKNLEDGSRVSRFGFKPGEPLRIDAGSEEIVLTFLQGGHNGCDLQFGPDGYLYISTGDATDPTPPDVFHTGQDITDLLSSILRIDIDKKADGKAYTTPADNPFVGLKIGDKLARPEVWAYGFRNPWRMSFDRKTGDLFVGDVGWETWEMIHKVEKGGNFGWSLVEARQPVNVNDKLGPTPVRPPAIELSHADAGSVTGGYVYRGTKYPELAGKYVFGDWMTRRVWAATFTAAGDLATLVDLTPPAHRVIAFGEDHAGELFVVDYDAGTVNAIVPNPQAAHDPAKFPKTLRDTGLFADVATHTPAPGVTPFAVTSPHWQDYSTAEHFVALPGTTAVGDYEQKKNSAADVNWQSFRFHFPANGVLVKTLSLDTEKGNPATRKRVETQLLHFDGQNWKPYTYAWRDDQADADLVPADGAEKPFSIKDPRFPGGVRHQTWTFAGRAQCMQCHNPWAEYTLGFNVEQLNRPVETPAGPANQLAKLSEDGILNRMGPGEKPLPPYTAADAAKQPKLTAPGTAAAKLEDRARGYLHANCGHCHRFGGGGAVEVEFHNAADLKRAFDAKPLRGGFDLPDAKIIAPGDPGRSTLYYRMAKFGSGRMPHFGADFVDDAGTKLIADWILSLKPDAPARPTDFTNSAAAAPLARKLADETCPLDLRDSTLAAAAKLPPGPVRDLFEGYFPHDPARQKLGSNPRPRAILSLAGDPTKGQELFATPALQCATCHKIDGKGGEIGPDLSDVGKKRPRDHLLESLLDPSRRIDPAFQAYLVKTVSGASHTGLLIRRTEKELHLRDAQGKELKIPADDIEAADPSRVSLMPAGLLRELSPQQAADLLAFLAARK